MTVTVRYFASLREELGFSHKVIEHRAPLTIGDVWQETVDQPPPANLLCALNHEYSTFEDNVNEGDEVAFFPPVNGG